MPVESEAVDIVRTAIQGGVRAIDTARGYGVSEQRIGLALAACDLPPVTVLTKLDPLTHLTAGTPADEAVAAAAQSLKDSRRALGRERLDVLMLHRPSHRTDWGGAVWLMLLRERDAGTVGKLGVSVQSSDEARAALADRDVEHLQVPLNLLDRRWSAPDFVEARGIRNGVTFHARSALLQGLLSGTPDARWPVFSGWSPVQMMLQLHRLAQSFGRESISDLCIAWVRAQSWVDGIVLGMETRSQIDANLAHFRRAPLSKEQCAAVTEAISGFPENLANPPSWPKERRPLSSWQSN
jgi:spore coat polysaccharide biosynthesis protein SpsF